MTYLILDVTRYASDAHDRDWKFVEIFNGESLPPMDGFTNVGPSMNVSGYTIFYSNDIQRLEVRSHKTKTHLMVVDLNFKHRNNNIIRAIRDVRINSIIEV